jgi:hypothetical protein
MGTVSTCQLNMVCACNWAFLRGKTGLRRWGLAAERGETGLRRWGLAAERGETGLRRWGLAAGSALYLSIAMDAAKPQVCGRLPSRNHAAPRRTIPHTPEMNTSLAPARQLAAPTSDQPNRRRDSPAPTPSPPACALGGSAP